ncbi:DNA polymerase III, delta subunit [Anaerovirgula multivorans]|uniref:DNA polymerase III subunit delta n=1 Tax=Anaerovirgula multivorans TaxID=312168 RepID=A0A239KAZ9_9FIRM|nr:DNA polymerase III subunit delta [Anaerovirgula multivorans]SNT15235.1 DNA polymerase III, delta subunit [Anaerovirgula multivorans]
MNYKEAIDQLKANKIQKVYLLYGVEIYLRNRFIKQLKNTVVNSDFEELNFYSMEGKDCTLERLIDTCETLPFMGERKLVLVNDFEVFQSKRKYISDEEEKSLIAYIEKIPDTTCLVFYGSTSVDSRKKIVKEIQKHGQAIEFQKLNAKDFKQWIVGRMKVYDKKIASAEIDYFFENVDYIGKNATQSLLDIDNELKKIISFIGDRDSVTLEDLQNIFSSSFQNDIFKLLDAIEKQQISEAMKRLSTMVHQGEPIMKIAATLGNHVRNLLKVKLLLEEGYSTKIIASKIGIHPFVASKCANQARGFTTQELERLLTQFLKMDVAIKSGKMKDYIAIELFILEICK